MRFSLPQRPFTLLIHIALAIILAGATVTHFFGIQGELTLSGQGEPTSLFALASGGGEARLPFEVRLIDADIDFYPGTTTPMDFRSTIEADGRRLDVAMNRVANVGGWRFSLSAIGPDATRFAVNYDPWGIATTYAGYALLGIGFIGFFFQRRSLWRSLLDRLSRPAMAGLFAVAALSGRAATELPTLQRPLANNLGKVYVYWNDRVCPLQTMAIDVATKLYGSAGYRGLTAEQVIAGWLFYYDAWAADYAATHSGSAGSPKAARRANECRGLVNMLGTGEAFRIYPYRAADGRMEWLSLTGRRPSEMSVEQWTFMTTAMPEIKSHILLGRNVRANELITSLVDGQIRYAGAENLPSPGMVECERFYNRYVHLLPPAILLLLLGGAYLFVGLSGRMPRVAVAVVAQGLLIAVAIYVSGAAALLGVVSGHLPLSTGAEMMLSMSLLALACAAWLRQSLFKAAFLIVAAAALAVASFGGQNPRVGMLVPVLANPLLSVHVMLVMVAYVLFLAIAILSVVALTARREALSARLALCNRVVLLPAVALLAAGIFVGAVWANQSWGRYWGWDPKETCALAMLLVYSLPLHGALPGLRWLRNPKALHVYLLLALLTVLFTYFGANYLLVGKHSYA